MKCKCKDCDCKKVDISLEREIFSVLIKATTKLSFDRCVEVIKKYCKENGYDFDNAISMDLAYRGEELTITLEVRKAEVA